MTWQVFLAISIITYSCSTILQKVLFTNKKTDPIASAIVFQMGTGLVIGVYALFHGFRLPNLIPFIPNILFSNVAYAIAALCMFSALKKIDASVFTVFFSSRAVWTILSALFFLHETFSFFNTVGLFCILGSIFLVSYSGKKIAFRQGEFLSLVAAVLFGIAFVNDDFIIKNMDIASYMSFSFLFTGVIMLVLTRITVRKMQTLFVPRTMLKLVVLCICYGISALTIYTAYQLGNNAGQIGALNQLSTIITVVLAIVFLKETTFLWRKIAGSIVAFFGMLLLQ